MTGVPVWGGGVQAASPASRSGMRILKDKSKHAQVGKAGSVTSDPPSTLIGCRWHLCLESAQGWT